MTAFTIYLISLVSDVKSLFFGVAIVLFCVFEVCIISYFVNLHEQNKRLVDSLKKAWTASLILFCSFTVGSTFIPSSQTLAAMFVIPAVVNNEKVQGITNNTLTILQNLTAKWADELSQPAEKK